jgi:SAM-dependent methyltransferase
VTNKQEDAEQSNQKLWDELAPVHMKSYESVELLRGGGIALDEIELREVGDVRGKRMLHLQCHIGTDTLSWARQGAVVTGIDFSKESIEHARRLQEELGIDATFIHANVYDCPSILEEQFDIVYTSRGVLCWLKNLDEWARISAGYLKPGGFFYLLESHPICNIFEDTRGGELRIMYPYFHSEEPTCWDDDSPDYSDGAYVAKNLPYEWTWSVGDIINALLKAGLTLEFFNEYDVEFFKRFPGMMKCEDGWYRLPEYSGKLPLMFTLKARMPVP